jgi:hypothetical protein
MTDTQEPEKKYICVAGGRLTRDGAVAIAEVHPDHPFHVSARLVNGAPDPGIGEHQVFVVKGDPKTGAAWAARTPDVQRALGREYLVEIKPPAWLADPIDGPQTESANRVANREAQLEPVTVGGAEVATTDEVEALRKELDAAKAELEERRKAEEDRLESARQAQEQAQRDRAKAEADAARASEAETKAADKTKTETKDK